MTATQGLTPNLNDTSASLKQAYDRQQPRKDLTTFLSPFFGIPSIDDSKSNFHVTATYLGDPTDETFNALAEWASNLSTQVGEGKCIKMSVTGTAKFGPKEDIPVLLVQFEDERVKAICDEFHSRYGRCAPGMPGKLERPNYHITCKGHPELAGLPIGTVFTIKHAGAKRLGPNDPFWKCDL